MTPESFDFLIRRVKINLPPDVQTEFHDALRLYMKRKSVHFYNHDVLRHNGLSVLRIEAEHTPDKAKKSPEDSAQGLCATLFVSKGCRMMIISNLLTSFGLVNGTMGTLLDVVWKTPDQCIKTLPCFLLFKPEKYTGPAFFHNTDGKPVVPILLIRHEWEVGLQTYTRTMFLLVLAYAVTIHKSQGITLEKAVLDLSNEDFSLGLSYMGISCARHIKGLMFDKPFDISRFKERPTETRQMRAEDAAFRDGQCIV